MLATRLFAGLGLSLLFVGCQKKSSHELVPVTFLPTVTITPSSRTMHRGDTLWLEANFSDSLLDLNSGHRYRVRPQDIRLNSAIFYKELLGIGKEPDGIAPTFRLVEKVGHASIDGAFSGTLEPVYDGHYYRARIGLIPTKACITAISLRMTPATDESQPLLPFIQLPPNAQGHEQRAQLDDCFYVVNNGQANNFDLFSQYQRAFALEPGTPLKGIIYEQKSTFTVEVK